MSFLFSYVGGITDVMHVIVVVVVVVAADDLVDQVVDRRVEGHAGLLLLSSASRSDFTATIVLATSSSPMITAKDAP
jgi:hypothetical protein